MPQGNVIATAEPGKVGVLTYGTKGVFGPANLPAVMPPFELLNLRRACAIFATLSGFTVILRVNGTHIALEPGCDMPTGGELQITPDPESKNVV